MAGFDTHLHSTASDGSCPPTQLVELAVQRGLLGLALTDHDTVRGLPAAAARAAELDIPFIPGIELSAESAERDVHILGYWLDADKLLATGRLQRLYLSRRQRAQEIAHRLDLLGLPIDIQALLDAAGENSIGRLHIAKAMVEAGYVGNVRDAFTKWLGRGQPAYMPREKLLPVEAVRLILAGGGVPAIAHPGTGVPDGLIPVLVREGVGGIEVYHPEHNHIMEEKYLFIARKYRLAALGGSDFHAPGSRELGCRITTLGQLERLARYKQDGSGSGGI